MVSPLYFEQERDAVGKLAKEQYWQIFEKQVRSNQGASYAEICFEPTTYHAVYWIWRAMKSMSRKKGWRFGDGRNVLTAAELWDIFPVREPGR